MPTNQPTVQPRGKCPTCSREVAVLDDGTVARPHLTRARITALTRRAWCLGYGLKAKPKAGA